VTDAPPSSSTAPGIGRPGPRRGCRRTLHLDSVAATLTPGIADQNHGDGCGAAVSTKRKKKKRVTLRLVFVDAWSSVKLAFLVAFVLAAVTVVIAFFGWSLLASTGLLGSARSLLTDIAGAQGSSLLDGMTFESVMAFTGVVALLELIIVTALGAVFAALFNLAVRVVGGAKVGFGSD
jgi:hypothetical protein